jgi:hypothetical protein
MISEAMNPFTLFILAILSPVLLAATLLVPPYAGIVAASYIIYDKGEKIHPLADKLDNVFYMIDVYIQLFSHWAHHITQTSVLHYALPLLVPLIAGVMLSLWLTGKLSTKLRDIFQIGMPM